MPRQGPGQYAASVARACAANPSSHEYMMLSSLMCWDAVVHVAMLAGVVSESKAKSIRGNTIVDPANPRVRTAAEMASVPEGDLLGFFEDRKGVWTMIHAMIAVGGGSAAGNKNDCIGAGRAVGWEVLDLASRLTWNGSGIDSPRGVDPKSGKMKMRQVLVCHCPVTRLG